MVSTVKRNSLLGGLFLFTAALAAGTVFLPFDPAVRTVASESSSPINYDSRLGAARYHFTESRRARIKNFAADFRFRVYPGQHQPMDLFQTGDANSGVRLEAYGKTLGLVVGADNAPGYVVVLVSDAISPGAYHAVHISIGSDDRIRLILDHHVITDAIFPKLYYTISDIAVGTGFSMQRQFRGQIRGFTYAYQLFDRNSSSLPWLRMALLLTALAALYALMRGEHFRLASVLGGSPYRDGDDISKL